MKATSKAKNEADQKAIRPDEVLILTKSGKWLLNNRELTKGEIDNLKSEAELIRNTSVWKLLIKEGMYNAQKCAIIDADTADDKKALVLLRKAQEFHRTFRLLESIIEKIIRN